MIPHTRRERYLQHPIPLRLGDLAADLARLASFSEIFDAAAVESLLEESRAFIEWSAPDLLPDRVEDAARLVEIQRDLTIWFRSFQRSGHNSERKKLVDQARAWSDEVLKMSGLLDQE